MLPQQPSPCTRRLGAPSSTIPWDNTKLQLSNTHRQTHTAKHRWIWIAVPNLSLMAALQVCTGVRSCPWGAATVAPCSCGPQTQSAQRTGAAGTGSRRQQSELGLSSAPEAPKSEATEGRDSVSIVVHPAKTRKSELYWWECNGRRQKMGVEMGQTCTWFLRVACMQTERQPMYGSWPRHVVLAVQV